MNHYQRCKGKKEKLKTVADINYEMFQDFTTGSIRHR